jgi:hypothetical protein
MSKPKPETRIEALEERAGLHRPPGGVIVAGQPTDAADWERLVADATAAAGPGAHLVVPGMALDSDTWEQQAIATQRRIAAGIFD